MITLKYTSQRSQYRRVSNLKENLLKFIPNLLSFIRIILSLFMITIWDNHLLFFGFYVVCGITDVLDGYIARKLNVASKLGSILDSIGDLLFFSVITYWLIFHSNLLITNFLVIMLSFILVVRIGNLITTQIRFQRFGIMHTFLNKITGALYFLLIPILFFSSSLVDKFVFVLLLFALISSIEEWFMIMFSECYRADEKSILTTLKHNKRRRNYD